MKKTLEKFFAAIIAVVVASSAMAVKINAPNDINNFNAAAQAAVTGLYVPTSRQILTTAPLAGGGDLTADRTISLGTLGTAGTYGDAMHTNVITTDAFGRISTITPTVITGVAASTAVTLATPRTIAIQTGDVTSSGASFNGSANETAATTLATVNSNIGTFGSASAVPNITVNGKGLITAVTTSALGTAATQNTGTSGATIPFLNGTNTWSGANTFSTSPATFGLSAGTGYNIVMTSAAGTDRRFQFQTGTSARWVFGATSTAESGGNAGSDFLIRGFDDTGTTINSTVITRSTGGWAFPSTISVSGLATFSSGITATLASDAASTDNTVCVLSTGGFRKGSGTLGICLGTSSARYKRNIIPLTPGLPEIMKLKPKSFFYRKGYGDEGAKEQYGLIAEEVLLVLPKLTSLDDQGRANSVDLVGMIPVLIKAVQDQQAEISYLKKRIAKFTH